MFNTPLIIACKQEKNKHILTTIFSSGQIKHSTKNINKTQL